MGESGLQPNDPRRTTLKKQTQHAEVKECGL